MPDPAQNFVQQDAAEVRRILTLALTLALDLTPTPTLNLAERLQCRILTRTRAVCVFSTASYHVLSF